MNREKIIKRLDAVEKKRAALKESAMTADNVDVRRHIAPVYLPLHYDVIERKYQNFNLPGGRGSCKSTFVSLEIVSGVMKDASGESNAIVFRRFGNTLRDSVFSQIEWAIHKLGVSGLWQGSVSPMQFTYLPTGAQILFRGLDDAAKLKSVKAKNGVFRFIWLEEFDELPGENFMRKVMQSVMRGGDGFLVFRSFNPPQSRSSWANSFVSVPDKKTVTFRTTYLDVPPEWLGEDFIYEAERLKAVNETAYRHEYLGEPVGTGGNVFTALEIREITDTEIAEMQYIYGGIDFGFGADPAVFLRVSYDRKKETVFLLDEIVKRNMSNRQLCCEIRENGYDKTGIKFKRDIWGSGVQEFEQPLRIVCDCAEPKSIADLRNEGLTVSPCRKFQGCVSYRIKWLQQRTIVIDPNRTPYAYKEFTQYEYTKDLDGNFLSDIPDKDNHTIDALAYALNSVIYDVNYSA